MVKIRKTSKGIVVTVKERPRRDGGSAARSQTVRSAADAEMIAKACVTPADVLDVTQGFGGST